MRQLKERRQLDDYEVLKAYIPEDQEDSEEDPAEKDPKLNEILTGNSIKSQAKMAEILDYFAEMQNVKEEDSQMQNVKEEDSNTEESDEEIIAISSNIL